MLAGAKWKTVSWRVGTKGRLKARFAALRVRTADGPPQRIWDKGQQHLPGDEAWRVGEQRESGRRSTTSPISLLRRICAHWPPPSRHDGFVSRRISRRRSLDLSLRRAIMAGLHRHALMTMIAYAFLQHRRLVYAGRKKKKQRTFASVDHARRTSRHRRPHPSAAVSTVPTLSEAYP
jgi:SRSO17 transposase